MSTFIAGSIGIKNQYYSLIVYLGYIFWVAYIYAYRSNFLYDDYVERAYLEKYRGVYYFFSLLVTILGNYIVLFYYPNIYIPIIMIVLIGVFLGLLIKILPRLFFKHQERLFDNDQIAMLNGILVETGVASIYFSFLLLSINGKVTLEFLGFIVQFVLLVLVQMFMIVNVIRTELKARRLADTLAEQMKKRRWYERYKNLTKKR